MITDLPDEGISRYLNDVRMCIIESVSYDRRYRQDTFCIGNRVYIVSHGPLSDAIPVIKDGMYVRCRCDKTEKSSIFESSKKRS